MRSNQGARLKNSHQTSTTSTEEDAASQDGGHQVPVDDERVDEPEQRTEARRRPRRATV